MDYRYNLDLSPHAQTTGSSDFIRISIRDAVSEPVSVRFDTHSMVSKDFHEDFAYRLLDGRLYEKVPFYPFGDHSSRLEALLEKGVRRMTPAEESSGKSADVTDTDYGQSIRHLAESLVAFDGRIHVPSMGPVFVLETKHGHVDRQPVAFDTKGSWCTSSEALTDDSLRMGIFRYDKLDEVAIAAASATGAPVRLPLDMPIFSIDSTDLDIEFDIPDDRSIRTEALATMVACHFSGMDIHKVPRPLLVALTELRGMVAQIYGDGIDPAAEPPRWLPDLFGAFRPIPATSMTRPLNDALDILDTMDLRDRDRTTAMIARFLAGAGLAREHEDDLVMEGFTL